MLRPVDITVVGLSGQSVFMDMDTFPVTGETVLCRRLRLEPGGKGYNQAVGCSRLGARVRFITAVGDDEYGRTCIEDLVREGIDSRWVKTVAGSQTALAVIMTDQAADNRVTVYPGAGRYLNRQDIIASESAFAGSDFVLLQLELGQECLEAACEMAARYQVPVMLNPAPANALPPGLWQSFDWLTPNAGEAEALAAFCRQRRGLPETAGEEQEREQPEDWAAAIQQDGKPQLVITLGSRGVYYAAGQPTLLPAFRPPEVVDTTGAGDAFNAALATTLAGGEPVRQAIRFAQAAAALTVSRPGVMSALPSRQAVLEFLQSQPLK